MSVKSIRGGILVAAIACVIAAGALAGCGKSSAEGEPHRVGVIVSLKGNYSALGEAEKNAIVMEAERINEAGGIDGRPIELLFEDDGTSEPRAKAAASKLIEKDNVVAVIGATGTGPSMAMRSDVDRSAVPQISMANGAAITGELDEYVFQTAWSDKVVVPFVLDYLSQRGLTKIALLTDTGSYGTDGRTLILEELPKAGLRLAEDQTFKPGDTDMTKQLNSIKASDAQVILMWTAGREAAIIATNRKQLGIELPLVGGPGNARREFITGSADAAEGFVFCAGKVLRPEAYGKDTDAYKVASAFVERYTETYGEPPDVFAGHAYDAFHLVVRALKRLPDGYMPVNLRDEIEKTKGFVGVGGTFTFTPKDHSGLSGEDLVMYRVEGGEWVLEQ